MESEFEVHISNNIPLLSLNRKSVVETVSLQYWEGNDDKHLELISDSYLQGKIYKGWSFKVALDALRLDLEKSNILLGVGGSLIYAIYSQMCHQHGGFVGYSYKNMPENKIPEPVDTLESIDSTEYCYISTLKLQNEFSLNMGSEKRYLKFMRQHIN